MRVLVTFAVQAEFAPLRRLRSFKRVTETEFVMKSGDTEVHAVITGIRARKFQLPAADICVVSGVAGSLKIQHPVGSVLVAKAVKREDLEMRSDGALVETAVQCGAGLADLFNTADN